METKNTPQKRLDSYKKVGPKWKDQYRKRCHERLKQSRGKFLERFRKTNLPEKDDSSVKGLMVEEWRAMCIEHKELPTLAHTDSHDDFEFDLRADENLDEVLYVFEEIRLELLKEEQQILREYDAGCYYDEQALLAAVKQEESPAPVMCPICKKNPIFINKGIVFCTCGVRIDTEQDCMTLDHIRRNIEEATESHSDVCESAPQFSVLKQLESVENLIMTCQDCDYMHIIV